MLGGMPNDVVDQNNKRGKPSWFANGICTRPIVGPDKALAMNTITR